MERRCPADWLPGAERVLEVGQDGKLGAGRSRVRPGGERVPLVDESVARVSEPVGGVPQLVSGPAATPPRTGSDRSLARIAWHDSENNSYWLSNTLLGTLDEGDMLAIAKSMDEAHS